MESTPMFLRRYRKSIQTAGFGVPGQEAMANARVLVSGTSDLLATVLSYLASAGTGFIGVWTEGHIQSEDLPAQPLFSGNSEGKTKGQAAAKQLREINPEITIVQHDDFLGSSSPGSVVAGYDLVIDCNNNLSQSLLLDKICLAAAKPLVYGALHHSSAFVSVFNFKGSASLSSMLSQDQIKQLYQEGSDPGLPVLAAITGSLMVNEAVKIIGEIGNVASNKLIIYNSFDNQLRSIAFTRVENEPRTISQPNEAFSSRRTVPTSVREISVQLLQTKIKYKETLQLVDIRENQDTKENVWNFLHIPQSALLERSDELHQDIMVVLISEDGEVAKKLAGSLNENLGFDNIYYLKGGFQEWAKETGSSTITYESF